MEIELSVTFAPELGEAVRAAAEEAERERRHQALREFLDEYQAEHGARTEEEMARARRWRDLAGQRAREAEEQAWAR